MSILRTPYEVSVWNDVWNPSSGKFEEQRICIIGSDKMESQSRALEPRFTRNVNGKKTFGFKMYKNYVDNVTGEKVENPFVKELISERKIKLYLEEENVDEEDCWHDFIIKNIVEDSSGKSVTCQLEDAHVQELSKNGFGAVLNSKVFFEEDGEKVSNVGTAKQLAERVLSETDWEVESEAFVQTIEEALVYLKTTTKFSSNPSDTSATNIIVHQCQDNDEVKLLEKGIEASAIDYSVPKGTIILAFYSSCTDKPHRFQYIYLGNGTKNDYLPSVVKRKTDSRIIAEKNCQCFVELSESEYDYDSTYGLYIPKGLEVCPVSELPIYKGQSDQVISTWYRGERYSYAQRSMYHPGLDRYVQLYKDFKDDNYFGYTDINYWSSSLISDLASNGACEGKTGWLGGLQKNVDKNNTNVEAVYGRFYNNKFISAVEDLKQGSFDATKNNYSSYIKVTLDSNSVLLNSGPRDHRALIENMEPGSEWAVKLKAKNSTGAAASLAFDLREVKRDTNDVWAIKTDAIVFSKTDRVEKNGYTIFSVKSSTYNRENFKKESNVQLWITGSGTYYISGLEIFKAVFKDEDNLLIPDEQAADLTELENRIVEKTYNYVKYDANSTFDETQETIKPDHVSKTPLDSFKPVYNDGAQKTRAVEVKESNYFNILQTLAETFGAWLKLTFEREEDEKGRKTGKVIGKKVCFKNYSGQDNHAGFKYGVNLKNIQRTYESKNLVTKLIVKNNSNQYADNGYCTITRAGANPTGENYIYDFSYYHNQGLLDARDYIENNYVLNGACGSDGKLWQVKNSTTGEMEDISAITTDETTTNLQGYFPRLKKINQHLSTENEKLNNIKNDLIKLEAEKEVELARLNAAQSGIDEVTEDFKALTELSPETVGNDQITNCTLGGNKSSAAENIIKVTEGVIEYTKPDWLSELYFNTTVIGSNETNQTNEIGPRTITFTATASATSEIDRYFYLTIYPVVTIAGDEITQKLSQKILIPANQTQVKVVFDITAIDVNNINVLSLLTQYAKFKEQWESADKRLNKGETNLNKSIASIKTDLTGQQDKVDELLKMKKALNQLFYSRYSRFIQEGTWIDEKYLDDELYYADALSVAYNSCYPQVAYNINVVDVSLIEGYELYQSTIGDKTFVEDNEFFGEEGKVEVIVTEMTKMLDDPSATSIKVQNFKNQFQDLFQKITATVQQTNYNTGSYEKAVALAEATQDQKYQFLDEALGAAGAKLSAAGQQSVLWGADGITVQSVASPLDSVRIVGGAILLSQADKNGEQKWVTGVTSDGISANLITAGTINTGVLNIMNGSEPLFRWDNKGITAFSTAEYGGVTSTLDTNKYVRFNKHGIYGATEEFEDFEGIDLEDTGTSTIAKKSTFYLGWEGLKVSNENDIELFIGDSAKTSSNSTNLLEVRERNSTDPIFAIKENGSLVWSTKSSPTKVLYKKQLSDANDKPADNTDWDKATNDNGWHKNKTAKDWYASYSYDGGKTWSQAVQIQSSNTANLIEWYYATSDADETPLGPGDEGYDTVRGSGEDTWSWSEKWKNSPSDAEHSAVNKYLWNYEETVLSNGTRKYSVPVLISTQGKSITKFYEFYAVTSAEEPPEKPVISGWDGGNLTYEETDDWECIDTSEKQASTKIAAQSEYIWNFEVVCFDDHTYSVGPISNIGTGGRGIANDGVKNYYYRTTKESIKPNYKILYSESKVDAPTEKYGDYAENGINEGDWHTVYNSEKDRYCSYGSGGDSKTWTEAVSLTGNSTSWSETIPEYDADNNNCYLWNYEETTYSDGLVENTPVTLLSRYPRNVKNIQEYYQISATLPSAIILAADGNSVLNNDYGDWELTFDQPGQGESLWNCELIEFSSTDENGENKYMVVPPARIAYNGVDSYTLSLDNDMDTIVQTSSGTWISGQLTVTATGYAGHDQKTGLSSGNIGEISLTAPDGWTEDTHYTFANNTLTLNPAGEDEPKGVPDDFVEGKFIFQWKEGNDIYAEKTFSLKKITSLADYDLVIPQVVYNSSQSGGTVTINVLKKSQEGTITISSSTTDTNIKLYQKSENGYKESDWSVSYDQGRTEEIHFVLASADGELDDADDSGFAAFAEEKLPTIVWDEEVVEFTQDGASLVCVTSRVAEEDRKYTHEEWTTLEIGDSVSLVINDITGLRVGVAIYSVGIVEDRYVDAAGETNAQVTVYGTITAIQENTDESETTYTVTARVDSVVFGGERGENGSAANLTFENMWKAFEDGIEDGYRGLIEFEYDEGENKKKGIGLDADLIKAGAISVGTRPTFNTDDSLDLTGNTFYAQIAGLADGTESDIDVGTVYMAGWKVTENSITKGTLGANDSFHMYSTAKNDGAKGTTAAPYLFGSTETQDWLLGVGSNFGVTKNGNLYCSNGNFSGNIEAEGGRIGALYISSGGFQTHKTEDTEPPQGCYFGVQGLKFFDQEATISFGDYFSFYCDSESGVINADGPLVISGKEKETEIILNASDEDETATLKYSVGFHYESDVNGVKQGKFYIRKHEGTLLYTQPYTIKWFSYQMKNGHQQPRHKEGVFSGKLYVGSNYIDTNLFTFADLFTIPFADDWKIVFQLIIDNKTILNDSFFPSASNLGTTWYTDSQGIYTQKKRKNNIEIKGNIIPTVKNEYLLGNEDYCWNKIFVTAASNDLSDSREKNSIETLPDKYERFFDLWHPVRYKYNKGTSGRYHTGFIAQEIVASLGQAGLDTQEFAGVMLMDPGTEKESWYLRRDEFVALNTWQIQKLKPRVTQLEEELSMLKARLQELEGKI